MIYEPLFYSYIENLIPCLMKKKENDFTWLLTQLLLMFHFVKRIFQLLPNEGFGCPWYPDCIDIYKPLLSTILTLFNVHTKIFCELSSFVVSQYVSALNKIFSITIFVTTGNVHSLCDRGSSSNYTSNKFRLIFIHNMLNALNSILLTQKELLQVLRINCVW